MATISHGEAEARDASEGQGWELAPGSVVQQLRVGRQRKLREEDGWAPQRQAPWLSEQPLEEGVAPRTSHTPQLAQGRPIPGFRVRK